MKRKHFLIYQITNKLNKMIYIGCHVTDNINDKYMGSGTLIKDAISKYGIDNFEKLILYNFDNENDMLKKEREIVNETFIKRRDVYNVILGGGSFLTTDTVVVKDNTGKKFRIHKEDPRYLSGEFKSIVKDMITVKDENGNIFNVHRKDSRYLNNEVTPLIRNKIMTKDSTGKKYLIDKDDFRYLNGELVHFSTDMLLVKDKNGKALMININDPRYLNGEFVSFWKNKKHKEETKRKIGSANSKKQKGQKNSQYGKCWIYNTDLRESKNVKKEELQLWLDKNWKKGRILKW